MRAQASRYRRVLHGRKPRWLLSGALASLAGYVALAVLAAHQQFFAIDYGTRTWIRIVREETPYLPMALLTELGGPFGILLLIALGSAVLLWRRQRRWALALPALMAGAGALQAIAKWSIHRARPDESPWGFPSGHVLSLVVFFGLMIWLVATASKRRRAVPSATGNHCNFGSAPLSVRVQGASMRISFAMHIGRRQRGISEP